MLKFFTLTWMPIVILKFLHEFRFTLTLHFVTTFRCLL